MALLSPLFLLLSSNNFYIHVNNFKRHFINTELIRDKIIVTRGIRVLLDRDIAKLYGVETKVLKQAVRRNLQRFPHDFMFEMTKEELKIWRSQTVTSNSDKMGLRYLPFCFTEQGVAMLFSILKSRKAIEVNIAIMRAFVILRQNLFDFDELKIKIEEMENDMNIKFKDIQMAITYLLEQDKNKLSQRKRNRIGFK